MTRGTLIVMAREASLGQVKSRLAGRVGPQAALDAYRRLLARTLELAGGLPDVGRLLCVTGDPPVGQPSLRASRTGFRVIEQQGAGLGERMRRAFETALPDGPAVVIGTDCPLLTRDNLAAAFTALTRVPAVLGPAEDGGYVLLGLARLLPVFDGPRWGGPEVLAETRALLRSAEADWEELPTLWDVDTEADWRRWLARAGPPDAGCGTG